MAQVRLSLVLPEGRYIILCRSHHTLSSRIPKCCSHNHSKRKQDSTVDFSHSVHIERTNKLTEGNKTDYKSSENFPGSQSSKNHRVEHIYLYIYSVMVLGYQVNK